MTKDKGRNKMSKERIDMRMFLSMAAGLCAVLFLITFYFRLGQDKDEDIHDIQDQLYDVTVGDQSFSQVDIAELTFTPVSKGTDISYRTILKGDVSMPVIRIYVVHSVARIYLDGELIYSYGRPGQHMLGYGFLMIPLPDDYTGRELYVEQTVYESGEVGTIRNPVVYNADHYFWALLNSRRLVLFTDTAMIMMSLAIIIVAFIFIRKIPDVKNLMWLAAAFIGIGMWEFCNTNLILLFAKNDLMLKGYLEYLSLYITPVFLLMYFVDAFYYNRSRKEQAAFLTVLIIQIVFIIAALTLHFSDILHLPAILYAGHFVIVLTIAYILTMIIKRVIRRGSDEAMHKEVLAGTLILGFSGLIDIFRFLLYKLKLTNNTDYSSTILLGMFIFALCMIIDFFNSQQKNVLAEARSEALEKLAYNDIMTGLYNRQKINEIVGDIIEEKGKHRFGIVNFDLNDLKKTNDNYGHPAGDRLLTDFSGLLLNVFSEKGIVARMGGDEFLVFYRDRDKADHDMLMKKLKEECDALNEKSKDIRISYASGYSYATEEELEKMMSASPEECRKIYREIYKRADDLMYQDKARIKAGK